ncbi:relaxase/mobilization nuclease domain-containing protein [Sphaerospermopsis aphanizomenoides BCCUSP55]|uniref:relaxase/mobilization nuclease domain-containing protein n=1 Tax=Sphaerospermopsis aphanizomenoides TaxID=459663 RepID=UPI000A5CD9BF|nr:relaxase/mobilization nuclease domain-containing protein [Sphaerospermopsis aphanizomenoides]MBK1990170.1 relaxase/mobilization nuclease domain-containing protein [Sphaerospermopsis aphanizomenoides BCCUSP55]
MIGKQFKNHSFRSTLEYVLGKEKATMIDSNMGGTTPIQLTREFGAARRFRPNLQRACAHVILSIPHRDVSHNKGEYHEHLEDEQYTEIAQHWLKAMKFLGEELNQSQYVVARHHDTNHEHIHIIASRIRMNGSVVPDSWDYRRSEVILRKLEKEYGLEAVSCSNERVAQTVEKIGIETTISDSYGALRYRRAQTQKQKHHSSNQPPITQLLADIIDETTKDQPTVTQLIQRLQQQSVVVHPQFSTGGLFKEAIAFEMNGVKVGGYKLGSAYSFPGLQKKRGVSYNPERDLPAIYSCRGKKQVEIPTPAIETTVTILSPEEAIALTDRTTHKQETTSEISAARNSSPELPEVITSLTADISPSELHQAITTPLAKNNTIEVEEAIAQNAVTEIITEQQVIAKSPPLAIARSALPEAIASSKPAKNTLETENRSKVSVDNPASGQESNAIPSNITPLLNAHQSVNSSQNHANNISPIIRFFWQQAGQPETYSGKYYDLQLEKDILKLKRKNAEEIAEISLYDDAESKDKGLTDEDLMILERLKMLLLTHNRQEEQENSKELE